MLSRYGELCRQCVCSEEMSTPNPRSARLPACDPPDDGCAMSARTKGAIALIDPSCRCIAQQALGNALSHDIGKRVDSC
jgi:hypothetical protein